VKIKFKVKVKKINILDEAIENLMFRSFVRSILLWSRSRPIMVMVKVKIKANVKIKVKINILDTVMETLVRLGSISI